MQEFKVTIGQRLKQVRLSRQISLEKAADATHIRPHYLQALEEDNYSAMSSAAQGRGFLRLYADFLGLDLEVAMVELRHVEKTDATPAPESVTPHPAPASAPQTPPASPADETPARRPFWARLLRKEVPASPALETDSASEAAPPVDEPPAILPVPEQIIVPVPEPTPVRVNELAGTSSPKEKKAKVPAKTDKPKSKPKSNAKKPAKTSDKKKVSLKRQSLKKPR